MAVDYNIPWTSPKDQKMKFGTVQEFISCLPEVYAVLKNNSGMKLDNHSNSFDKKLAKKLVFDFFVQEGGTPKFLAEKMNYALKNRPKAFNHFWELLTDKKASCGPVHYKGMLELFKQYPKPSNVTSLWNNINRLLKSFKREKTIEETPSPFSQQLSLLESSIQNGNFWFPCFFIQYVEKNINPHSNEYLQFQKTINQSFIHSVKTINPYYTATLLGQFDAHFNPLVMENGQDFLTDFLKNNNNPETCERLFPYMKGRYDLIPALQTIQNNVMQHFFNSQPPAEVYQKIQTQIDTLSMDELIHNKKEILEANPSLLKKTIL